MFTNRLHSQILSIFDSLDAIIYVLDPRNYMILYANPYMKKVLNKDPVGGFCYKEIKGLDNPCIACKNPLILENEKRIVKHEYYNRCLNKYYRVNERLIKWKDGRKVRLQFANDISDSKKAQKKLEESQKQLRNLTDYLREVRENERKRIAREIHDELGQLLTTIKIDLSRIEGKLIDDDDNNFNKDIKNISLLTDKAIDSVHKIATDLRPALLDSLGLASAIEYESKKIKERTGHRINLYLEEINITNRLSTNVFRIFQETVTNILRHAKADKIEIRLIEKNGDLILHIGDNGIGIPPQMIHSSNSLGIIGIRERVRFLGGSVNIRGIHNKGTFITVTIPVKNG